MRLAILATLLCFALPAHADVVKALERGVKWAGQKSQNRTLSVRTRKGQLELDPDGPGHGRILLHHMFSQEGFKLGADGKVVAGDRERLATVLKGQDTRKQVLFGIRRAQQEHRVETQRLATADKQIDALLVEAKKTADRDKSGNEITLHDGTKAYVTFRHGGSGPMLILTQGSGQHGIYLKNDGKGGFSLHPQDRSDLATALLAN